MEVTRLLTFCYGFPHTYMKVSYQCVSEGPMNRTSLTMHVIDD